MVVAWFAGSGEEGLLLLLLVSGRALLVGRSVATRKRFHGARSAYSSVGPEEGLGGENCLEEEHEVDYRGQTEHLLVHQHRLDGLLHDVLRCQDGYETPADAGKHAGVYVVWTDDGRVYTIEAVAVELESK